MEFFKRIFMKKKNQEIIKSEESIEKNIKESIQCNSENCGCKSCEHKEEKNGDYLKNICIQIETIPCEPNPYFVVNDESAKFFEEFEIRMTTICRMYSINSIFLKEYQKVSRESLTSTRDNEKEFPVGFCIKPQRLVVPHCV